MRSVAIVTGAGRGIGRAIADELSKADYAVARVSIEPQEQGAIPTADRYYQSDVADIAQHGALLARIASDLGEPCCLVNNARLSPGGVSAPPTGARDLSSSLVRRTPRSSARTGPTIASARPASR
jgi:NAD(P)-dependent dehydrogenase (short-subunit alcohol dehydrogenase family)